MVDYSVCRIANRPVPILILDINVDQKSSKSIPLSIYSIHDDPIELVRQFHLKHRLSKDNLQKLEQVVATNLQLLQVDAAEKKVFQEINSSRRNVEISVVYEEDKDVE